MLAEWSGHCLCSGRGAGAMCPGSCVREPWNGAAAVSRMSGVNLDVLRLAISPVPFPFKEKEKEEDKEKDKDKDKDGEKRTYVSSGR